MHGPCTESRRPNVSNSGKRSGRFGLRFGIGAAAILASDFFAFFIFSGAGPTSFAGVLTVCSGIRLLAGLAVSDGSVSLAPDPGLPSPATKAWARDSRVLCAGANSFNAALPGFSPGLFPELPSWTKMPPAPSDCSPS